MTGRAQIRRSHVRVRRGGGVSAMSPREGPPPIPTGGSNLRSRPPRSSLLFPGGRGPPSGATSIFRSRGFRLSSAYGGGGVGRGGGGGGGAGGAVGETLCGVFDCSPDLAGQIFRRGRLRDFPVRHPIVRQGDRISTLYVITAGRAHAIVYSLDGQVVLLHEYLAGDFFGVVSPPYSAIHDADVIAVEAVTSFLLDGNMLALLAEQHGCIGLALLRAMVD